MAFITNKAVVKLIDATSEKVAKKALVGIDGLTSHTLDIKKSRLVMIGDIDAAVTVNILRNYVKAELVTFGPEKDEGKPRKNDGDGRKSPMVIRKNKAVVKLGVNDAKSQKATKKALVGIEGLSPYTLDFKKSMLVVLGDCDPIVIVNKLRKAAVKAELVTFGPERDEGTSQHSDGSGGSVDQKPQQQRKQHAAAAAAAAAEAKQHAAAAAAATAMAAEGKHHAAAAAAAKQHAAAAAAAAAAAKQHAAAAAAAAAKAKQHSAAYGYNND